MSSVLKVAELGQISICGRQAYFCSLNEDLPEYLSSFFLSLLGVKLGLPHKFRWGAQGNYHHKSLCAHSFVWEGQPWQEFQTFLSFSSFCPSSPFQTRGLHPPSNPVSLHSTRPPEETQSRAESAYFQSPTVNKQGCSCCLLLPHRRFLFCCGEVFMNFPSAGPSTPASPTHVSLWVKSMMNHTQLWLSFINDGGLLNSFRCVAV